MFFYKKVSHINIALVIQLLHIETAPYLKFSPSPSIISHVVSSGRQSGCTETTKFFSSAESK